MNKIILSLFPLKTNKEIQFYFDSKKPASKFIDLKLDGYKMYQYIQSEYTYIIPLDELETENISFKKLYRETKTWFGLFKKTETDILIEPQKEFFYPHEYGYYLYLFTKQNIGKVDFEIWLNKEFPSRKIDEVFTKLETLKLMNDDDYLILTNHDCQEQFDVIGDIRIIKQLASKFSDLTLKTDQ